MEVEYLELDLYVAKIQVDDDTRVDMPIAAYTMAIALEVAQEQADKISDGVPVHSIQYQGSVLVSTRRPGVKK